MFNVRVTFNLISKTTPLQTHVFIKIFPDFGVGNPLMKSVRIFCIHSVYTKKVQVIIKHSSLRYPSLQNYSAFKHFSEILF